MRMENELLSNFQENDENNDILAVSKPSHEKNHKKNEIKDGKKASTSDDVLWEERKD